MPLDPRRLFTRREVWRAWQLQDQKCKLCSRLIPFDLMHGDHIVPWSRGGTVNDAGQVVGYCLLKHRATPRTWRNRRVERLPLLRGGDRGQAVAINDRGQIVGWTNYAARQPLTHAVIWEHGTITDLGTVAGTWSQATDINNKGQIAGSSSVRNGNPHAVLWTQRTP